VPDLYVFGDESGDLDFTPKASRFFIVTTATMSDCAVGDELLRLRRQLAWAGVDSHADFHAAEEQQSVRDRVFEILGRYDFRVDTTIFEKAKVQPHLRTPQATFYQFAWFYHLKYVARRIVSITKPDTRLLVAPATLAQRKAKQEAFSRAVRGVVAQVARVKETRTAFWSARTDPCLWAADYCSWAIQRKWQHTWQGADDDRSYQLVKSKIRSEFDIFALSGKRYY
jgi:hypothetical protein